MATKLERRQAAENLAKALSNPLRSLIWRIISERKASAIEIAREIGETNQTVSYHIKVLVDLGCAEEVDSVPRRGATEKYFRATIRPMVSTEDWDLLPLHIRQGWVAEAIELEIEDRVLALKAGMLGPDGNHILVRDLRVLDEQGLTEMREWIDEQFETLNQIEARSLERRAKTGEPGVLVASSQGLFRVPPKRGQEARDGGNQ